MICPLYLWLVRETSSPFLVHSAFCDSVSILYSLLLNSAELRAEAVEGFQTMTAEKLFKAALVLAGQSWSRVLFQR